MRVSTALLLVLAAAATAFAAPPDVCLPETVVPQPMPPTPTTSPIKVTADRVFVIQSKEPVVITSSKDGLLKVTQETDPDPANKAKLPQAPYRVTAKFADGPDKMVKRSFAGPYVYTVEPAKSGAGELLIIPRTVTADADMIRRDLVTDDGTGPIPPPVPPNPPVPPTPPTPVDPSSPIPSPDGTLKVLVVYEKDTLASLPQSQVGVLTSADLRMYLNAKCGTSGYVITDKDVKYTTKVWADAMARDRKSVPWIVVGNGKTGYEGPLPATVADTLTLLKKYGGN